MAVGLLLAIPAAVAAILMVRQLSDRQATALSRAPAQAPYPLPQQPYYQPPHAAPPRPPAPPPPRWPPRPSPPSPPPPRWPPRESPPSGSTF
jgi:hypothetical protein